MDAVSSAGSPAATVPPGDGPPEPRTADPADRPPEPADGPGELTAAAGREVSAHFERSSTVVAEARSRTAGALRDWGCPADAVEDAVTVVSELVTNAVVHGVAPIGLRVALADPVGGRTVRIEVTDGSTAQVQVRPPSPTRDGGRGLRIVHALAARHGVLATGDGKTVWVELLVAPDPAAPPGAD